MVHWIEVLDMRSRRWSTVPIQLPHKLVYATAQVVNGTMVYRIVYAFIS